MPMLKARCNLRISHHREPALQVYICGESDSVSLPDDPVSIQPRPGAMKSLQVKLPSPLAHGRLLHT